MSELAVFLVAVGVFAIAGVGIGILVAPRLERLADRDDATDDPADGPGDGPAGEPSGDPQHDTPHDPHHEEPRDRPDR